MPKILDDFNKETDTCHTPLERQRREGMSIRRTHFGFFRVSKEPIEPVLCFICDKNIHGVPHLKTNGIHHCNTCKVPL